MVRIQHILCPVDFSDFSRHAFDCAVGMARNYGADVTVLHVLPVPSLVPALPYGPEGPGPFGFETVGRERALVELKQFLNLDSVGVPVHFRIAEGPSVHNEILLQASRLSADLVVMGTHGRSGFDRLMLGSAAGKTLRASRVPVLIVPPRTPEAPAFSRDAFRHVLRIASERDVDLIVLGVHGRNAMDRLVFGSTTEHVVRRGTCPVLTVPAPLEH